MATIGKLVVSLSANSAKLVSEFQRSKKEAEKWAKDIAKRAKSTAKVFTGVATAVGAVITGSTIAMVNRYAGEIDKLAKTADKLGVGTAELQKLRYQAELSGVGVQTLDMALQRMVRRVSEAASGTGEAKDALKELGIDARLLEQMKPEQQFYAIAQAMKQVEGQSDRVRLAMKLFDSEGVALVNTLGSDLEAVGTQFDRLGISISRRQAAMVEAYNDAKSRLNALLSGFGTQLTVSLAGPFQEIVNWVNEVVEETGGMKEAARDFASFSVTAISSLVGGIGTLVTSLNDVHRKFLEIKQTSLEIAQQMPFGVFGFAMRMAVDDVDAELKKVRGQIANIEQTGEKYEKMGERLADLQERIQTSFDSQDPARNSGYMDPRDYMMQLAGLGASADKTQRTVNDLGSAATGAATALKGLEDWQARIKKDDSLFSKLFKDVDPQKKPYVDNSEFNTRARATRRLFNSGNFNPSDAARMLDSMQTLVNGLQKNADVNYDISGMRDVVTALKAQAEDKLGFEELAKAVKARQELPAVLQLDGLGASIDLVAKSNQEMAKMVTELTGAAAKLAEGKFDAEALANAIKERQESPAVLQLEGLGASIDLVAKSNEDMARMVADMTGAANRITEGTLKSSETAEKLASNPPVTKFEIALNINGQRKVVRGQTGDTVVENLQLERAAAGAD